MDFSSFLTSLSLEQQQAFDDHVAQAKLDAVEEASKTHQAREVRTAQDQDEAAEAQQDARSSAVPSTQAEFVDSLTKAIAATQANQQQRGPSVQSGTLRVQQGAMPAKFDGVVRNGEDGQSKRLMFETQMVACFGQHDCLQAIESEVPVKVGLAGEKREELIAQHGELLVTQSYTAWGLIVSQITHVAIMHEIMQAGSPSEGWKIFKAYFAPQAAAEKARLVQGWYSLSQQKGESPNEYFSRCSVLCSRLATHGVTFPPHEANQHIARRLSDSFEIQKGILLTNKDLDRATLEDVVRSAHGELELRKGQESHQGSGHALVVAGSGLGHEGEEDGGTRERGGRGRRRRGGQQSQDDRQHREEPYQQQQQQYNQEQRPYEPQQQYRQQRPERQQQDNRQRHAQPGRGRGGRGGPRGQPQQYPRPWPEEQQQYTGGRQGRGRQQPNSGGRQAGRGGRGSNGRVEPPAHGEDGTGRGLAWYHPPPEHRYRNYPSHLPRPQRNEPPIHPGDPRARCEGCGELGHVHTQCLWRTDTPAFPPPRLQPHHGGVRSGGRYPTDAELQRRHPCTHSYGSANIASATGPAGPPGHAFVANSVPAAPETEDDYDYGYEYNYETYDYEDYSYIPEYRPENESHHYQPQQPPPEIQPPPPPLQPVHSHAPSSAATSSPGAASSSRSNLHALMARFVPQGKFDDFSENSGSTGVYDEFDELFGFSECNGETDEFGGFSAGTGGVGLPGVALASTTYSEFLEVPSREPSGSAREVWVSDNGATNHITDDERGMYDWVSIPKGKERVLIGDGTVLRVLGVGSLNLRMHAQTDFDLKLTNVYLTQGAGFNLFSLHEASDRQTIILDRRGVHLFGGRLTFPRRETGAYLQATRLYPTPTEGITAVAAFSGRTDEQPPPPGPPPPPDVDDEGPSASGFDGIDSLSPRSVGQTSKNSGHGSTVLASDSVESVVERDAFPSAVVTASASDFAAYGFPIKLEAMCASWDAAFRLPFQPHMIAGQDAATYDSMYTAPASVVPTISPAATARVVQPVPPASLGVVPPDPNFAATACVVQALSPAASACVVPHVPPASFGVVPTDDIFPPGFEKTQPEVRIPTPVAGLFEPDMSVFRDVQLMDGVDTAAYADFCPVALRLDQAQALTASEHSDHTNDFVGVRAAAVLAPSRRPYIVGKYPTHMDINTFHCASGHLHATLLRETAKQHGVQLTGELQPCGGCVESKGVRAGVPRRTTSRAAQPMETVHIDLAGPYGASMGGSHYLIMFVDSASRFMRPYGMVSKSETPKFVRKFLADMNAFGKPRCFRTDNGGEFTSSAYADLCDSAGIRREYTAPGKPQQNAVVESAIWRAVKGGHAARREVARLFPEVDTADIPNIGPGGERLWLEAVLWAADCFNRSATKANSNWRSPYEVFHQRLPPLQLVPFLQPGMMRVDRVAKSHVQSVPCFYLNNGYNHPSSAVKVLKASTGAVCYTSNIVWMTPRTPVLPLPAPDVGGGSESAAAPTTCSYTVSTAASAPPPASQPTAAPSPGVPSPLTVSTTASAPPPASQPTASPSPGVPSPLTISTAASAPPPVSQPTAAPSPAASPQPTTSSSAPPLPPLPARVIRELGLETEVRVPGRTRSKTVRFQSSQQHPVSPQEEPPPPSPGGDTQAFPHGIGLLHHMDKDALVSMLATRLDVDSTRRKIPDFTVGGRKWAPSAGGHGGTPCAFAALLATRGEVDATLRDQRPPHLPPDLPHCYASDLKVPRNYAEAMRSEHAGLWRDSVGREFFWAVGRGDF